MVTKYTWLKILDTLNKRGSRISVGGLRFDLDSRGFHIDEKELSEDLRKMLGLGLIESDLLVSADGAETSSLDDSSSIGISTVGARKLTAIVKI